MRKLLIAATAVPTVAFILSCSGIPGASYDNVGACKKYVAAYNALKCIPKEAKFNEADICPAALDMNPTDMTKYYECMASNSKCDGKVPDLSGVANCVP